MGRNCQTPIAVFMKKHKLLKAPYKPNSYEVGTVGRTEIKTEYSVQPTFHRIHDKDKIFNAPTGLVLANH